MSLFAYTDQSKAKRVVLVKNGREDEGIAGGTITPGQLVYVSGLQSDGVTRTYAVHATAGGYAEKAFAVEDALQGNTLDTDYTATTRVILELCNSNAVINAFLADGENVSAGDLLESNGNGDLRKRTSGVALAIAQEALDLSASANSAHARLVVRVL